MLSLTTGSPGVTTVDTAATLATCSAGSGGTLAGCINISFYETFIYTVIAILLCSGGHVCFGFFFN